MESSIAEFLMRQLAFEQLPTFLLSQTLFGEVGVLERSAIGLLVLVIVDSVELVNLVWDSSCYHSCVELQCLLSCGLMHADESS